MTRNKVREVVRLKRVAMSLAHVREERGLHKSGTESIPTVEV